jgi:hypothetical protein
MSVRIQDLREPVSERDIEGCEAVLGHALPDDYRTFLLAHNGGCPEPNRFTLLDPLAGDRHVCHVNELYELDELPRMRPTSCRSATTPPATRSWSGSAAPASGASTCGITATSTGRRPTATSRCSPIASTSCCDACSEETRPQASGLGPQEPDPELGERRLARCHAL